MRANNSTSARSRSTRQGVTHPRETPVTTGGNTVRISTSAGPLRTVTNPVPFRNEILDFFGNQSKAKIAGLDVETNGLSGRQSVLSCSAIKYQSAFANAQLNELGRFDRYYFPREQFDPRAIAVNGLTRDEISRRRRGKGYPEHFKHDSDFETFCEDVHGFICHNIEFEARFIDLINGKKKFCTMKSNTGVVDTEYLHWENEHKWPTLAEAAAHYGIPFDKGSLHNSMTDVEITAKIFEKMLYRFFRS